MFIEVVTKLEVEPERIVDFRGGASVEPEIFLPTCTAEPA